MMDIELIRSNIDAAMDKIRNNPYGATSIKNTNIAMDKLQEALDETYADGDKYKSRMCGRHNDEQKILKKIKRVASIEEERKEWQQMETTERRRHNRIMRIAMIWEIIVLVIIAYGLLT